jgi:hypothetical protein
MLSRNILFWYQNMDIDVKFQKSAKFDKIRPVVLELQIKIFQHLQHFFICL